MNYKKVAKTFFVVGTALFILMQFIQPNRDNPPVDPSKTMQASLTVPENVNALIERGCKDCHSNATVWPFYAYIAPASWLVSYDVKEGRKHFNMSEWEKYKFSRKANILGGIASTVKEKEMPLPKYIPLHPEANLTQEEREILIKWAQSEGEKMMKESDSE